jgi:hypothetical protein
MSSGRPAPDEQPIAIKSEIAYALRQEGQGLVYFFHDLREPRIRRKRIADHGDIDPVGAWSVGDEGKHILVVALPITPWMNTNNGDFVLLARK